MSRFWHPFSNMAETRSNGRVVFTRGRDCTIGDVYVRPAKGKH